MADISAEIDGINTNPYGSEVVSNITSAATKINNELEESKLDVEDRIEEFVQWLEGE